MRPSTGVAEFISTVVESAYAPPTPMPTPTSAVTSGRPAAISEPRVSTSTRAATARPITSPIPTGISMALSESLGRTVIPVPCSAASTTSTTELTCSSVNEVEATVNWNWNSAT